MTLTPDKREALWFCGGLFAIAVAVNLAFSTFSAAPRRQPPSSTAIQSVATIPLLETNLPSVTETMAPDAANLVNAGISRPPGTLVVACAAATESGEPALTIKGALLSSLTAAGVQVIPEYFTPDFLTNRAFERMLGGSREAWDTLRLAPTLDAVVLAREKVQYSKDESLANIITATLRVTVAASRSSPMKSGGSWTFVASGAGFTEIEALHMAEERIKKQITNAADLRLAP
jgi:hypothetical protein